MGCRYNSDMSAVEARDGALRFKALIAVVMAGVAALLYFDLQPPLAHLDDWVYAWSVRQLVAGHGLRLFPEQSSLNLVQIVWSSVVLLGNTDQRLLRLSALPFMFAAAVALWMLARTQGADRFWSVFAGAALVGTPIYMAVSSSFMGEPFYLGLLLAAAVAAVRWARSGKGASLTMTLTLLASLQRQLGLGILLAVFVGLLAARSNRAVSRSEWAWLGFGSLGLVATHLLLPRLGISTPMQSFREHDLLVLNVSKSLSPLFFLPLLLGFFLLPFLPAIISRPKPKGRASFLTQAAIIFVVSASLIATGLLWSSGARLFPGDFFSNTGLGPPTAAGEKVALFTPWFFTALEVACVLCAGYLLVVRRNEWTRDNLGIGGLVLVGLSVSQLLPMIQTGFHDRYDLPVILPLLPIVAGMATRAPAFAAWAGLCLLGFGLGIYVIGQQDYGAWLAARDGAARLAYQRYPPAAVAAGYEAYGVYVVLPLYDRTGGLPESLTADLMPSLAGPPDPVVKIEFAGPDNRAPGVSYWSAAPGRMVIAQYRRSRGPSPVGSGPL